MLEGHYPALQHHRFPTGAQHLLQFRRNLRVLRITREFRKLTRVACVVVEFDAFFTFVLLCITPTLCAQGPPHDAAFPAATI